MDDERTPDSYGLEELRGIERCGLGPDRESGAPQLQRRSTDVLGKLLRVDQG